MQIAIASEENAGGSFFRFGENSGIRARRFYQEDFFKTDVLLPFSVVDLTSQAQSTSSLSTDFLIVLSLLNNTCNTFQISNDV